MTIRIYKPTKITMQSGRVKHDWVLETDNFEGKKIESLMGWTAQSIPKERPSKLFFDTKDEALAYAKDQGLSYELIEPHTRKVTPKSFMQNFKVDL